jgi:sialidase-1
MSSHEISRRTALLVAAAPLLDAGEAPLFEQVDLFQRGDAGIHTYRIPALVETRKGTLIAVVDARHDSDHDLPARISLMLRRSHDHGKTWSRAVFLRRVKEGGVGDASLLVDRNNGRVWCFHSYGPPGIGFDEAKPGASTGPATLQFHAMYSDDDGAHWPDPVDLTPQVKDPAWRAMFATSGTDIQTSTGRYLVPLVVAEADGRMASRNAYSDDGGKTWKAGAPIGSGTDESHNVEIAGGVILQNLRNASAKAPRAIAFSTDGGVTFGPMTHDAALIDPDCNAGITRYRRGKRDLLVFTNAASLKRRENLTVRLSYDSGKTWPRSRTIHPKAAAYSTVIQLSDGMIGVLYERGESYPAERITFARFNPGWVERN